MAHRETNKENFTLATQIIRFWEDTNLPVTAQSWRVTLGRREIMREGTGGERRKELLAKYRE